MQYQAAVVHRVVKGPDFVAVVVRVEALAVVVVNFGSPKATICAYE